MEDLDVAPVSNPRGCALAGLVPECRPRALDSSRGAKTLGSADRLRRSPGPSIYTLLPAITPASHAPSMTIRWPLTYSLAGDTK
jgi:hypothetical protein